MDRHSLWVLLSPNVDFAASVDRNGWQWCVFSWPGTISYLTTGLGDELTDPQGHFSADDTDPVTLKIAKTFPTGWKGLPQDLVVKILAYLEDNFRSLVSCSKSCKALFCSTRPLIHRTLCLSTGHLTDRHRSCRLNRAQLDNLRLAERAQVLQYTTLLIIRLGLDFVPGNLRPYLQYFRTMRTITSLQISRLNAASFLPAFDECFGYIVPTLRSLTLIGVEGPVEDVFGFIPRFPLLQDLNLTRLLKRHQPPQPYVPPEITTPPPLNGTLKFQGACPSVQLIQSLMNVPGGIHFRSIKIARVDDTSLQAIIDACSKSVELIAFATIFREYLRSCTVSGTHLVPKQVLCQTSGSVQFLKGSGSLWQAKFLRTTSSKFTYPRSFRPSYLHPSPPSL